MRKYILLLLVSLFLFASAGCSGTAGALGAGSRGRTTTPGGAARTRRTVESTPVPSEVIAELPERPTFSIEPVVVRTPVPVFAEDIEEPAASSSENASTEPGASAEGGENSEAEDPQLQASIINPGPAQDLYPGRTVTVRWFDLNEQRAKEAQYPIEDGADVADVVAALTTALREQLAPQTIQIVSTTYENAGLTVDFAPGIRLLEMNSGDENAMLQNIADTYLLNIDGIQNVFYTIEGEPYRSEHIELAEGEPYKTLTSSAQ